MNRFAKQFIVISLLSIQLLLSQGYKIETDQGTKYITNEIICNGRFWTEVEGKAKMEDFSQLWGNAESWRKRSQTIRKNILKGMQWDKISSYDGDINVIKHSKKIMDGYTVENIAIESFPGFYVTGNLYRPIKKQKTLCCYIESTWTSQRQAFYRLRSTPQCLFG
jgi:hypothetical protein